jgi:uncharacterized protein
MKYLVVLGLVLVVFWLWRSARQRVGSRPNAERASTVEPVKTEIVACDFCHIHLPRTEALTTGDGTFCSEAHRRQAGH